MTGPDPNKTDWDYPRAYAAPLPVARHEPGVPSAPLRRRGPEEGFAKDSPAFARNHMAVRAFFAAHLCATQRECSAALGLTILEINRHVEEIRGEWKPTLQAPVPRRRQQFQRSRE